MSDTPILSLQHVTRILPGIVPVTLVEDISFDVRRGEFIAITGASGSGKSSLLYLLGLLDDPTSGELLLDGISTTSLSHKKKSRMRLERLGFIFQFHFLIQEFSVLDNILLPMQKLGRMKAKEQMARAEKLLEDLDVASHAKKDPTMLSGGQRQRIAIARSMANDPDIILADEPTGNLDTKNASKVFDIFERLVDEFNKTVIVVTHDSELASRCRRKIHIKDGRLDELPTIPAQSLQPNTQT